MKLSHEDTDEIEVLMDVAITIFWLSIRGAHLRHRTNTTEPSVCSGDAALCHFFTLTTCLYWRLHWEEFQKDLWHQKIESTALAIMPHCLTVLIEHELQSRFARLWLDSQHDNLPKGIRTIKMCKLYSNDARW